MCFLQYARGETDRQTDRQTLITILHSPIRGRVSVTGTADKVTATNKNC